MELVDEDASTKVDVEVDIHEVLPDSVDRAKSEEMTAEAFLSSLDNLPKLGGKREEKREQPGMTDAQILPPREKILEDVELGPRESPIRLHKPTTKLQIGTSMEGTREGSPDNDD